MKAHGFTGYGDSSVQEFIDREMSTPMAGELLVEVRVAGVKPVDWKMREGQMRASEPLEFSAVLGSEVSGVVREPARTWTACNDQHALAACG